MEDEKMIYVPLSQFVDGVTAQADLESIRAILASDAGYASNDIKAVLGIEIVEVKKDARTD